MQRNPSSHKTLVVPDNLDLQKLAMPEIPKDIIFPDELNRYLRDQVQYLTHENGMLYKNLSDAEGKIKESKSKISFLNSNLEEYQNACPNNSYAGSTANLASGKIVELSKKLRERNSELEVYKTKCSKLEKLVFELEKTERTRIEDAVPVSIPEKPKNVLEEQIKTLQEKFSSTNTKLCEARNSNAQLKNDLKLANKVLQQEMGETFETLQSTFNSNPNWRGRAQIICDLQQKNCDLREKLKMYQEKDKNRSVTDVPVQLSKQDKRIEALSSENEQLKNIIQDLKRRLDAVKARSRVLETESSVFRSKVSSLLDQTDQDSQKITSLTAKVSYAQHLQNDAVHQKEVIIQKLEKENKMMQMQLEKLNCKMDNFNAHSHEQKREIDNLKDKVKKQLPLSSPKTIPVDSKTINQLEAERLRLLDLTKLANDRLESERTAHALLQTKFRQERQRGAKLESKVARLQLDQQSDRSSSYSNLSLKSKESESLLEDRLQLAHENVKALETRLQMEREEHKVDIEEFTKILKNFGYFSKGDGDVC